MHTKPLLILAFNRPKHLKRLIDSLRPHQPQKILVGIDGPRKHNPLDEEKIAQVLVEVNKIDWTTDIELRIREENLGLRFAVVDAVSWAIKKHGEIIVVEDDIEVGPDFISFMSDMLDRFRHDYSIGHISGYNLVPEFSLSNANQLARVSRIPESYAWGTWSRAWDNYDQSLSWPLGQSLRNLSDLLGGYLPAIVWKINFFDAKQDAINTWAYRWIGSLWANGLRCVSPNRNLVTYTGLTEGTHTRTKPNWQELPVESVAPLRRAFDLGIDHRADGWILKNVFGSSVKGVLRRIIQSMILNLFRKVNRI